LLQGLPSHAKISCRAPSALFGPGELRQALQRVGNHAEIGWLAFEYRDASIAQARQLRWLVAAMPGHDQVGFERQHALQVERGIAAH